MKSGKQKLSSLIFAAIALAIAVPFMTMTPALADTLYVPSLSYANIQAAINAAVDGDIIEVATGIYYENVSVNKEVTIQAGGGPSPIVDGSGSGSCFTIYLSGGLDNVTITGFEIQNAEYGIRLFGDPSNFNDITISNNNIHDHKYNGILVTDATVTGLTISNNTVTAGCAPPWQVGISFANHATVTDLIIDGNVITGNCVGLGLLGDNFSDVEVTNCYFADNAWEHIDLGIWWTGPATLTNVQISNCQFLSGTGAGVYIDSTAVLTDPITDPIMVNYNDFLTGAAGIWNTNPDWVNGECNWWNAADGPSWVGTGSGDGVSDKVFFEPWLLSSGPDSVCGGYKEIATCMEDPKNHGQFVSCVAKATKDLVKEGVITAMERAAIQRWAAHADIP